MDADAYIHYELQKNRHKSMLEHWVMVLKTEIGRLTG